MDNLLLQQEEIETLTSIYQNDWKTSPVCKNSFSIKIATNIEFFVTLNEKYPKSMPDYELLAPVLTKHQKQQITQKFQQIFESSCGYPILYQWIETLKDIARKANITNISKNKLKRKNQTTKVMENIQNNFEMVHGPTIEDRKSIFQGHAISVFIKENIGIIREKLLQNRKIAQAKHNITAYRIQLPDGKILEDSDNDGENQAGKRLLHLLQLLEVRNVMVVVTRWFGGIQIGADRFKHINDAARLALIQAKLIQL